MLNERTRRLLAATEARALGHGGVSQVRRACGLSRKAIAKGIREIDAGVALEDWRIRRPGAGRKPITVSDPDNPHSAVFRAIAARIWEKIAGADAVGRAPPRIVIE